VENSSSTRFS